MRPSRFTALYATLASLTMLGVAFAASLEPISSAALDSFDLSGSVPTPNVLTYTGFPFAVGTNLNGQTLEGGGSWIAERGNWEMGPSGATITNANKNSRLTTNVGRTDATVVATITWSRVPFRTGVVVNSNGTNALLVTYESIGSDTVEITGVTGNTATSLGRFAVPTSTPPVELEVESLGNTLTIRVNGVLVTTYTLTPAQMTTYKSASATRFGIVTDQKRNGSVLDFRVET